MEGRLIVVAIRREWKIAAGKIEYVRFIAYGSSSGYPI
jgi:hypothetical protein